MADEEVKDPEATGEEQGGEEQEESLKGGAYDVIRNRLLGLNRDLLDRVEKLNSKRKQVFGGTEAKIIGNDRIQTDNNCVARDIFSLGNLLVFGYNVFVGLRSEITLEDVFSVHKFADGEFKATEPTLLQNEEFLRHFQDLYKYYNQAKFLQFVKTHNRLLMLFQIGETTDTVKIFRWSIDKTGKLSYMDDRGDNEYKLPPQHGFTWTETGRDQQVAGVYPHVSIKDRVFVETVGGDLTVKIENNTTSGEGIYSESVDDPDQTLDDAEIYYAEVGNLILLKILPYRETRHRYIVFNAKTETAVRIDSIAHACIELPEDHGIIFPKGYYLQNGVTRQFDEDVEGMKYMECIRSPNGEDFLYVFYQPDQGRYILLQYNLITKEIANPIFCHGFTRYDDGQMVLFSNPDEEPKRVHPMQIWQTPFCADTFEKPVDSNSALNKIGNRDLVKGVSDCYTISRLITTENVTFHTYRDLIAECTRTLDSYHWLEDNEVFNLRQALVEIKQAGVAAVDEYDKVVRIRENTAKQIDDNEKAATKAIKEAQFGSKRNVDDFVSKLNDLRSRRGQVISLRELKYADQPRIDRIEQELADATEKLSLECVEFLLQQQAMDPFFEKIKDLDKKLEKIKKVADLKEVETGITKVSDQLDLLTDIVNNLQIDDSTKTTRIVDAITEVYGQVNRVKSVARNIRKELGKGEASAEFAAQFKLVTQSITNYIGLCDTPAKCDDFLGKIMVTIEELEGRFADYDEYIEQLTEKREEAYSAFTNRKQILEEEEKRRVGSLISSAERIMRGIRSRAQTFKSIDEVNSYFASDLMVSKIRDIIERLHKAENTVKADDLTGQLKALRDETLRKLRDKLDLFTEGENIIKFGDYSFNINTQPLNLTTVFRDGDMYFHLTGTDYYELVENEEFLSTKDLWEQDLVSENREVYRAEYLAHKILMAAVRGEEGLNLKRLTAEAKVVDDDDDYSRLLETVQDFAANLYSEGYDKGIHDQDAARILKALIDLYNTSGLLRYDSGSRAFAIIFWAYYDNPEHKNFLRSKIRSYGTIGSVFDVEEINRVYIDELHAAMRDFFAELVPDADPSVIQNAAEFLFYELQDQDELLFTINKLANDLYKRFDDTIRSKKVKKRFYADVEALDGDLKGRLDLVRDWLTTYCRIHEDAENQHLVWEVIALIVTGDDVQKEVAQFSTYVQVEDLLGQHRNVEDKRLDIYFDLFLLKMTDFVYDRVPRFEKYVDLRNKLTAERREGMRLEEFESQVMGSFVRNRLINNVYLQIVGANFAKQLGVAGEGKRTDLMGLLLLISPPGYGKTTLMEYVSNRLGLTFMKINGPAIGHLVTSLDPAEAPNATAREELQKLNLALEMGNNIMIYLDDIQHVNPEFLQKFISLCDAQRKIEGVFKGRTRTYDLRGKKVCVIMAGNPYTESGEKFKIPDMLANRADTYNLGDVSSTAQEDFALSFVENAMTSNPVLTQIANRSHEDLYRFWQILETGSEEGADFDHPWSNAEVNEILHILGKLKRVQEVVLKVNEQYIYSAAQQDDYRTEPPFKLQGSYRNMNRMAEKVFPVMTDEEVDQLIFDHYYNEAQTLTSGAEANMLKFKELVGILDDKSGARWTEIKNEFNRRQTLAGADEGDQVAQILAQLSAFTVKVGDIRDVLDRSLNGTMAESLKGINFDPVVNALDGMKAGLTDAVATLQAAAPSEDGKPAQMQIDITPVVTALQGMQESFAEGMKTAISQEKPEAAPPIDITPMVEVIEKLDERGDGSAKVAEELQKDFAKVCDRQITAIECLLPIMESIKVQSDTFLQLKEMLDKLMSGVIQVEVRK